MPGRAKVPEDISDLPQADVSAMQLLARLLELVRNLRTPSELTHEKVTAAMGMPMLDIDEGVVGHAAWLTPEWFYWFEYEQGAEYGPTITLRITSPTDGPLGSLDGIEFDPFAEALVDAAFTRDTDRGEHGEILAYQFRRHEILVEVATRPKAPDSGRQRITSVTVS